MNETQEQKNVQPKSPLNFFFSLGDKVTGGDPIKKLDFDYYMMWIMFLAFAFVFGGNMYSFYHTLQFAYLGWSLLGLAIMWFQYFNLKMIWTVRKQQKDIKKNIKVTEDKDDGEVESPNEMEKLFKGK